MTGPEPTATAVQIARAALSRLLEPSDLTGLALVRCAGPVEALRIATGEVRAGAPLERELGQLLAEEAPGAGEAGVSMRGADSSGPAGPRLDQALGRWQPRVADLAPLRDLGTLSRLGGRLLCPEDPAWPTGLEDLGLGAPIALWVRGDPATLIPQAGACIAVVGSRDSTSYGAGATSELAGGLVRRGYCVISGGAYGIDAQAHRAALACGTGPGVTPTISVMACGVDRYYPAGNEDLLRAVARHGLLIAEVPPGSSPTRWRFLQRNRLIAALCAATIVVEARWRSGALNTAHHAAALSREVGAVPGSIQSANSAGCHRLLREGSAVCVTDAAEAAELAAPLGQSLVTEPQGPRAAHDGLNLEDLLLLDALPVQRSGTPDSLAKVAGLSHSTVLAGLGRLQISGLAESVNGGWRRTRSAAG